MSSNRDLFLTQTKHGIWYYQRWTPARFREHDPKIKKVFRVSLRTKDKKKAACLSRTISVKIDKLALRFFDDPEQFGKAMKLLSESTKADEESGSFQDYEEKFLFLLDDYDEWLLSKAYKFDETIAKKFEKLRDEIEFLKNALLNNDSNGNPVNSQELISQFKDIVSPPLPDSQNPKLDELFDQWKGADTGAVTKERVLIPAVEFFIRVVNDFEGGSIRIADLDLDHIHRYQNTYKKIPLGTEVKKYSISQLLSLSGVLKAPKTILDNFTHINGFLNWVQIKGYPLRPNLPAVLTRGSGVKVDEKLTKGRTDYNDDELRRIFNSDDYTGTGKFYSSAMYWAPLIALFTGARLAEIIQLEAQDIKLVGDIYVFDFNDSNIHSNDDQKRIKTKSSRRQVPIHKQLLDLGFLEYASTQNDRIFPDEPRNRHGKFDAFQKRQKTYRNKIGVTPDHKMQLKDFHTYRHTVETRLNDIRATGKPSERFGSDIIDEILGHASRDRSTGQRVYNHSQIVKAKNYALNRLKYDSIDFDAIIPWDKCSFSRAKYRKRMAEKLKNSAN